MSTIDTSALSSLSTTQPANANTNTTLDQSSFLKLMTAQLTMQDPFNPVDNSQMVAQMAQFSTVSGISEMNKTLSSISEGLQSSRFSGAANWIGKTALLETDQIAPLADGSYKAEVALLGAASSVTVNFTDTNGQLVHSETLSDQSAGTVPVAWDGRDEDGNAVQGPLTVSVTAKGSDGKAVEAATGVWTTVTGIQSPASGTDTLLVTDLGLVSPEDVVRLG